MARLNIDFYRISGKNDPIINAIEIIDGSGNSNPQGVLSVNPNAVTFPDTEINTHAAANHISVAEQYG